MNANTIRIEYHEMRDILYKLFLKYKFTEKKALLMANEYTESTLVGVNSHGINRVPLFIEYIEKGIVKVDAEAEKKKKVSVVLKDGMVIQDQELSMRQNALIGLLN